MSSVPMPDGVDPEELVRKWTPGAEAGDAEAMLRLCMALLMKQDWDSAELWAQCLADGGSVIGMRFLAQIREERGDEAGAREWARRADEAHARTPEGRGVARLIAPIVARFGEDPDPELLRAAAQAGDAVAMTALGMLLIQEDDLPEAVRWLAPGAEAGDTLAVFGLGVALTALGDDEGAGRWLEQAAESGDSMLMDVFAEFASRTGDAQKARYWKDRALAAAAEEDTGPGS